MIDLNGLKLDNLDEIMVVNRKFEIVYYSRFDDEFAGEKTYTELEKLGKNVFEAYPSIKKEQSSFTMAIASGNSVTKRNQKFSDSTGKVFYTHNITVPLIKQGKIVGAVELSKDITTIENVESKEDFSKVIERITDEMERYEKIDFDNIITDSVRMKKTIERAKILSKAPTPTLIYGETGTGKELFAQAMIEYSGIDRKKVVVQNCASVPDNLIESILFGTVKGAYTGAENKKGLFEEADGGIFFLDELNSLPYHVQGKLLRVLQDGKYRPVGSSVEKRSNVKIIAAMNIDPKEAIKRNELRKDLFYRLNSGMVYILPLKERKEDLELLLSYYINYANEIYNKNVEGITANLRRFLYDYSWEGNVRELKHLMEAMISVSKDIILDIGDLPAYMYDVVQKVNGESNDNGDEDIIYFDNNQIRIEKDFSLANELQKIEIRIIEEAMKKNNNNKTKAAKVLNIPRQTLTYKIKKFNIKMK